MELENDWKQQSVSPMANDVINVDPFKAKHSLNRTPFPEQIIASANAICDDDTSASVHPASAFGMSFYIPNTPKEASALARVKRNKMNGIERHSLRNQSIIEGSPAPSGMNMSMSVDTSMSMSMSMSTSMDSNLNNAHAYQADIFLNQSPNGNSSKHQKLRQLSDVLLSTQPEGISSDELSNDGSQQETTAEMSRRGMNHDWRTSSMTMNRVYMQTPTADKIRQQVLRELARMDDELTKQVQYDYTNTHAPEPETHRTMIGKTELHFFDNKNECKQSVFESEIPQTPFNSTCEKFIHNDTIENHFIDTQTQSISTGTDDICSAVITELDGYNVDEQASISKSRSKTKTKTMIVRCGKCLGSSFTVLRKLIVLVIKFMIVLISLAVYCHLIAPHISFH
jgi:hypothetical protein